MIYRLLKATLLALLLSLNGTALCKTASSDSQSTVEVSSLKELLPYLSKDNINLVMKPGVYRIGAKDVKAGKYNKTAEVVEGQISRALLLVEGNGNTLDFTGVTIEVESEVVNSYSGRHYGVHELHILGSNNTIKGLTLKDIGHLGDFPRYGWLNVLMDGANNHLEGVEILSRGSKPYGYGEVFGKGRGYVIKHWKHSACLVRGNNNSLKNCRIIHHAYGHFLFMQGAKNVTIEGCYIEGEMTSSDTILAEKGTGSSADKINFMTQYGYPLPSGYTLALGEDGIRTYTAGSTMVDGVRYTKRRTSGNIIVKDCIVKHARGGVALTLGSGTRYVENCTLIGCQNGYSVNNGGKIVNCRADAALGAAFVVNYEHNRDITADITIMPYEGKPYGGNGPGYAALITGSGHNITLRRGEGLNLDQDIHIAVGGDRRSIGALAEDENHKAERVNLINETGLKVIIDDNASNNTIISNGEIVDNGTNNTTTKNN